MNAQHGAIGNSYEFLQLVMSDRGSRGCGSCRN